MRILVTGGAGFIGSAYVRHVLAHTDHAVTIYDAFTYAGHHSTLRDVAADRRVVVVEGDVRDGDAVAAAMAGHGAVVHLAAETSVDRSILGGDAFVATNCVGTHVVVDVARRLDVGRVLVVGTDEVYGSVTEGASGEDDRLDPRSPYSASKAGADLIALSHHATYGTPVLVTRCTNNVGPFQLPEKVVPLFTTNLLDGLPVPLYGDGLHQRDWLHVDDHCAALQLVLEQGAPGTTYNVGAGATTANRVLVDKLLALTGASPDLVEHVADRPGHDRRYSVATARIAALGWTPAHDLDATLAETVDWYRANEWWWRPLKAALPPHR